MIKTAVKKQPRWGAAACVHHRLQHTARPFAFISSALGSQLRQYQISTRPASFGGSHLGLYTLLQRREELWVVPAVFHSSKSMPMNEHKSVFYSQRAVQLTTKKILNRFSRETHWSAPLTSAVILPYRYTRGVALRKEGHIFSRPSGPCTAAWRAGPCVRPARAPRRQCAHAVSPL